VYNKLYKKIETGYYSMEDEIEKVLTKVNRQIT